MNAVACVLSTKRKAPLLHASFYVKSRIGVEGLVILAERPCWAGLVAVV